MEISSTRVLVKKAKQPIQEGFKTVEPTDDFVYKGEIVKLPGEPVYVSNRQLLIGDVVLFAKYSPDTVEIDIESEKMKFISRADILAVQ